MPSSPDDAPIPFDAVIRANTVIPAQAGMAGIQHEESIDWIPACAGMTEGSNPLELRTAMDHCPELNAIASGFG